VLFFGYRGVAESAVCDMFWHNILETVARPVSLDDALRTALIDALAWQLTLDVPLLQKGALHGLGHLGEAATREQIDEFIASHLDSELVGYARSARTFQVL
jgi:hypothetical protein